MSKERIELLFLNSLILASCILFYQRLNVGKFHKKANIFTKSWESHFFQTLNDWIQIEDQNLSKSTDTLLWQWLNYKLQEPILIQLEYKSLSKWF